MGSQGVRHDWSDLVSRVSYLPLLCHKTLEYGTYSCVYIRFFFSFIFISWRLITLQYCSGFCHTLTWISHGFTCIPHPEPPPTSLSTWSLWVFPVHQVWALVSCIPPGLVICFTLDNIHVFTVWMKGTDIISGPVWVSDTVIHEFLISPTLASVGVLTCLH